MLSCAQPEGMKTLATAENAEPFCFPRVFWPEVYQDLWQRVRSLPAPPHPPPPARMVLAVPDNATGCTLAG